MFCFLTEEGLERARTITQALYEGSLTTLADLSDNEMKSTFTGAPLYEILLQAGMTVLDIALKTNCFPNQSKRKIKKCFQFCQELSVKLNFLFLFLGDAIRLISAGGFYVNLNRCQNVAEVISPTVHILKNGYTLLRTGKRNYCLIKWHK